MTRDRSRTTGDSRGGVANALRLIERHCLLAVCTVGVLVSLPSLYAGLFDDDLWQRRFLLDRLSGTSTAGWWLLFGVPLTGQVSELIRVGHVPWWTSPEFQLSFFRPLATITHYLDYWAWPQTPLLMHLQNTVWYGLLCLVVAQAYRYTLGSGAVATLAGFMYALDDANLEAVAWIAARNSVLTAVFSTLTLVLLAQQARAPSRGQTALAALALAFAHLSSEGAIATWAYIIGQALFDRRQALRSQVLGLLPCAVVSCAFLLLTRQLKHGVVGSGAYVDPRVRPLEFAELVMERLPKLVRMEFGPPSWLSEMPRASSLAGALWIVACVIGAVFAARAITRSRELCALVFGSFASMLVVCAARPEPRLLLLAGIGAHALQAAVIVALWSALRGRARLAARVAFGFALASFVSFHVMLAPAGAFYVPESYRARHRARLASAGGMEIGPEDAARVIAILNGPSYFDALSICTYRLALWPHPWRAVHILGASVQPVQLTRVAPDSLVLETANGYLLERTSQQARSPDEPFAVGQTTDLEGGVHVVVDALTPDGRPQRIRLELPSDHTETMRFLNWNEARRTFTRIALPSVGGKVQL